MCLCLQVTVDFRSGFTSDESHWVSVKRDRVACAETPPMFTVEHYHATLGSWIFLEPGVSWFATNGCDSYDLFGDGHPIPRIDKGKTKRKHILRVVYALERAWEQVMSPATFNRYLYAYICTMISITPECADIDMHAFINPVI